MKQKIYSLINLFLVTLSLAFSAGVVAEEFDLRISDDALHGNFSIEDDASDLMFGLGYFYKDEGEAINIANIDLHASGRTALGNMPTTVGIGFQGNYMKEGAFKASAIGVGAMARVNIPEAPGLSIEGSLHYAPDVLAFSDADAMKRLRLQTNYRIIKSADIALGYRYLNAGIKNGGDRTFESGPFLGIKLKF